MLNGVPDQLELLLILPDRTLCCVVKAFRQINNDF